MLVGCSSPNDTTPIEVTIVLFERSEETYTAEQIADMENAVNAAMSYWDDVLTGVSFQVSAPEGPTPIDGDLINAADAESRCAAAPVKTALETAVDNPQVGIVVVFGSVIRSNAQFNLLRGFSCGSYVTECPSGQNSGPPDFLGVIGIDPDFAEQRFVGSIATELAVAHEVGHLVGLRHADEDEACVGPDPTTRPTSLMNSASALDGELSAATLDAVEVKLAMEALRTAGWDQSRGD